MNEYEYLDRTSIINVKNKLDLEGTFSTNDTIYVKCPFCNSKNGSLRLNIINNSYICNNCEESGFAIGLYAKLKHISNKEAYKRLMNEEANIGSNITKRILINNRKNDEELDYIYQEFLNLLDLQTDDTMSLLKQGFSIEEIDEIGFKTIPVNEYDKIKICDKLIDDGVDLTGIPGFYQNNKFRWTFKSHKGFFIPIRNNGKIIGLRIHLNKPYKSTSNIWFSSGDKNNGTKASNNIMILLPNSELIKIMNGKTEKKDIIIVSEMILAYRIFELYKDKIVIGVPNVISKTEMKKIDRIKGINNIYLIMESYCIKHSASALLHGLNKKFGTNKVNSFFSFKDEVPQDFINTFERKNMIKKIA